MSIKNEKIQLKYKAYGINVSYIYIFFNRTRFIRLSVGEVIARSKLNTNNKNRLQELNNKSQNLG